MLHTLLMALILPATAIAILAVTEMMTTDREEDESSDWARPYLPAHNSRKPKH
jgi:hypothetical protein